MTGGMGETGVRVSLLGPFEWAAGGAALPLPAPQTRAVLAALAVELGSVVSVGRIIEAVWAEHPPASAPVKVQGHVSRLRKELASGGWAALLMTRQPGYLLDGDGCDSDLAQFARAVHRAETCAAARPEAARAELDAGLALWRGAAFGDVPGDAARHHADRWEQLRCLAVEDRAELDLRLDRPRHVLEHLVPHLAAYPLGERCRELLIRAYLRLGQRHAALACYEEGALRLREELGVRPSVPLQRLAAAVRADAVAAGC